AQEFLKLLLIHACSPSVAPTWRRLRHGYFAKVRDTRTAPSDTHLREYGRIGATAGMCADTFWHIAEAGTEKPIEVRNIRKTSLHRDVANADIACGLCCKQRERMFQP